MAGQVSGHAAKYINRVKQQRALLNTPGNDLGSVTGDLYRSGAASLPAGTAPNNTQNLSDSPGFFDYVLHGLSAPANMVQASARYFTEDAEDIRSKNKAYNAGVNAIGGIEASSKLKDENANPKYSSLGQALGAANTIGETRDDASYNLTNLLGKTPTAAQNFAFAMGTDPLMYVPGAAFTKPFTGTASAFRAVTGAKGGRTANALLKEKRQAAAANLKASKALAKAESAQRRNPGQFTASHLADLRARAESAGARLTAAEDQLRLFKNPDELAVPDEVLSDSYLVGAKPAATEGLVSGPQQASRASNNTISFGDTGPTITQSLAQEPFREQHRLNQATDLTPGAPIGSVPLGEGQRPIDFSALLSTTPVATRTEDIIPGATISGGAIPVPQAPLINAEEVRAKSQAVFDNLMASRPADLSTTDKALREYLRRNSTRKKLTVNDAEMLQYVRANAPANATVADIRALREEFESSLSGRSTVGAQGLDVRTRASLERQDDVAAAFAASDSIKELQAANVANARANLGMRPATVSEAPIPGGNTQGIRPLSDNTIPAAPVADDFVSRFAATEPRIPATFSMADSPVITTNLPRVSEEAATRATTAAPIESIPVAELSQAVPGSEAVTQMHSVFKHQVLPILRDEKLKGIQRVTRGTELLNREMLALKEADLAAGRFAVIEGADEAYHLWPIDITRVVDENIPNKFKAHYVNYRDAGTRGSIAVGRAEKDAQVLAFSSYPAGAAVALDLRRLGANISDKEAVAKIIEAMRKFDKTSAPAPADKVQAVAEAIWKGREQLAELAIENGSRIIRKNAEDTVRLSDEAVAAVNAVRENPMATGAQYDSVIASMADDIERAAKASGASASAANEAVEKAIDQLVAQGETLERIQMTIDRFNFKNQAIADGFTAQAREGIRKKTFRQIQLRNAEAARNEFLAANGLEETTRVYDDAIDISTRVDGEIQNGLAFSLRNFVSRISGDAPKSTLRQIMLGRSNAFDAAHRASVAEINAVAKEVPIPLAKQAHEAMVQGLRLEDIADDAVRAAVEKMTPLYDKIFDMSITSDKTTRSLGTLFETGIDPAVVNEALKRRGVYKEFAPANTARLEELKKSGNMDAYNWERTFGVVDDWKSWTTPDDPLDQLSRLYAAGMDLHVGQQVAMSFAKEMKASSTYKPGYVQITRSKGSQLTKHLAGIYLPKSAVPQLAQAERMLEASTSFAKSESIGGRIIHEAYDPLLAGLKSWMTVVRPGHHIRNVMGDAIATFMDLGWKGFRGRHYANAGRYMQAGQSISGDSAALLANAVGKEIKQGGTAGQVTKTITLRGGKQVHLTDLDIWRLAERSGLMPNYRKLEDITEVGSAKKGLNKLTENRIVKTGGWVSEQTSQLTRLAHLDGLLSEAKFTSSARSLDELFDNLRLRVAQFHPDPQLLSPFEQKYLRRIFPFYSWTRSAVAFTAMTAMSNPARVLAVPRATHATMLGQGIDPGVISMEDQFPDDKLYPTFIQDKLIGPILPGGMTMSFGSPVEAMNDMFNGDVGKNFAQMVSPIIKTPYEALTRKTFGDSDQYIPDVGEKIDGALPGINQIASLSGFSPSGTVANFLSGNFGAGIPDPQRAVVNGEKNHFFNKNLVNFLTGIGIQDTERPSYTRIAARGGWQD